MHDDYLNLGVASANCARKFFAILIIIFVVKCAIRKLWSVASFQHFMIMPIPTPLYHLLEVEIMRSYSCYVAVGLCKILYFSGLIDQSV